MTNGWIKNQDPLTRNKFTLNIAHYNNTHHPYPSQHQRSLFGKRTLVFVLSTMYAVSYQFTLITSVGIKGRCIPATYRPPCFVSVLVFMEIMRKGMEESQTSYDSFVQIQPFSIPFCQILDLSVGRSRKNRSIQH